MQLRKDSFGLDLDLNVMALRRKILLVYQDRTLKVGSLGRHKFAIGSHKNCNHSHHYIPFDKKAMNTSDALLTVSPSQVHQELAGYDKYLGVLVLSQLLHMSWDVEAKCNCLSSIILRRLAMPDAITAWSTESCPLHQLKEVCFTDRR